MLHPAAGRGVRRVSLKPATLRYRTRDPDARASKSPATEVVVVETGVCRASLLATPPTLRRVPPVRSQNRCHHRLLPPCRWHSPGEMPRSRFPLPVGGRCVCPERPRLRGVDSANGSVASGTLAGAWIARSFHGLVPLRGAIPTVASRDFPGATRRSRRRIERPALTRRRIAAVEPRTSLPALARRLRGSLSGGVVATSEDGRPPWGSRR